MSVAVEARDLTRVYEIRRGPLRDSAKLQAVGGVSFYYILKLSSGQ